MWCSGSLLKDRDTEDTPEKTVWLWFYISVGVCMEKLTLYVFTAFLILCSCAEDILNISVYAKEPPQL